MKMLLVLVLALQLGATQEPPKPGFLSASSAVIRGRITSAADGKPLRRARVTLLPAAGGRQVLAVSTNAQGAFEMKEVPPGSYLVSAARAGYLTLQHGQRRAGARGASIEIKNGDVVQGLHISLPRGSVLAGRVVDELGEPYPGIRVNLFELRYRLGRRVPFPVGGATTDDLGQYRISGLNPGSYYISASSDESWLNEKKEPVGFAPTYFPGAAADGAQAITIGVSQERLDLDFRLSMGRPSRLRGRVERPTGEPMAAEAVYLGVSFPGTGAISLTGGQSTRTAGDGTFELRNVAPGDYNLRTVGPNGSADLDLPVNGDVDNLVLVPRTGSTVIGTIVTDEGGPPPFPASGVQVQLVAPDENVLPTVRLPSVNNDWSIRMKELGGPFLFRMVRIPEEWMLDTVKIGDRDITDVPWHVPTGGREIDGFQMVLTRRVGTIAGDVVGADRKPAIDATVVVFSEDEAHWMPGSRFVRTARPNTSGQFSITGLPAGTYHAIAREVMLDGQWEDTAFLESVRREAARVVVAPGSPAAVSLKLP